VVVIALASRGKHRVELDGRCKRAKMSIRYESDWHQFRKFWRVCSVSQLIDEGGSTFYNYLCHEEPTNIYFTTMLCTSVSWINDEINVKLSWNFSMRVVQIAPNLR